MMNNIEYINGLKIDWNLYKGATSGNNANKSKSGFVDFIINISQINGRRCRQCNTVTV